MDYQYLLQLSTAQISYFPGEIMTVRDPIILFGEKAMNEYN